MNTYIYYQHLYTWPDTLLTENVTWTHLLLQFSSKQTTFSWRQG